MSRVTWSVYKNDEYLGDFVSEEVSQITGMRRNKVSTYADLDSLYKGVYRIKKVQSQLYQEWNKVVEILKQ